MIKIETTITFDYTLGGNEEKTIGHVQICPNELLLLPEYLDEEFEFIKSKIKNYIRNLPDREFDEFNESK